MRRPDSGPDHELTDTVQAPPVFSSARTLARLAVDNNAGTAEL
jgi:hypothetical protein